MMTRKNWLWFSVLLMALVVFFQNCSGQLQTRDSSQSEGDFASGVLNTSIEGAEIPLFSSQNDSADFALKGDCQTDDTESLKAFFNKGGLLRKPIGGCYLISDTLLVPSNIQVRGEGRSTLIKMRVPVGSYARPVLDLAGSGARSTNNIHISNLSIDAGGELMAQLPIKYNGNIGYGAAIIVQSSNSSLTDIWIKNAWDNGIGFYQLGCIAENNPNQQCNGYPVNVTALRIECENSGIGEQSKLLGSCVNALTSRNTLIVDSIDRGSSTGFAVDYWGSASATLRNLKAYDNKITGFWIGSSFVNIENVESHGVKVRPSQKSNETAGHGMVIERFAANRGLLGQVEQIGRLKGFKSTGAERNGLVIAASGWKLEDVEIVDPNQAGQRYVAIYGLVNTVEIAGTPVGVSNTTLINPFVRSTSGAISFDYGYDEETRGAGCISIEIIGGQLLGHLGEKSARTGKSPCKTELVDRSKELEFVVKLFKTYLYRTDSEIQNLIQNPQSGVNHYADLLMTGSSRFEIESEIRNSDEAFVKSKFLEALKRLPEKEEFSFHIAKLKAGQSRAQVESDIKGLVFYATLKPLICEITSTVGNVEGQRLVLNVFKEKFQRCPQESGLKYWIGIYLADDKFKVPGELEREILAASVGSNEAAFVKSLCLEGDTYIINTGLCKKK